jgi:hypothetical protein
MGEGWLAEGMMELSRPLATAWGIPENVAGKYDQCNQSVIGKC